MIALNIDYIKRLSLSQHKPEFRFPQINQFHHRRCNIFSWKNERPNASEAAVSIYPKGSFKNDVTILNCQLRNGFEKGLTLNKKSNLVIQIV